MAFLRRSATSRRLLFLSSSSSSTSLLRPSSVRKTSSFGSELVISISINFRSRKCDKTLYIYTCLIHYRQNIAEYYKQMPPAWQELNPVSYTHLRAHETRH